jgi:hypothetical protein
VNACNGALCDAVQRKGLGFQRLSAIRNFSRAVASAYYTTALERLEKPFGKDQKVKLLRI